jgi:hypothetical protein
MSRFLLKYEYGRDGWGRPGGWPTHVFENDVDLGELGKVINQLEDAKDVDGLRELLETLKRDEHKLGASYALREFAPKIRDALAWLTAAS